jgi:hypothetical protein
MLLAVTLLVLISSFSFDDGIGQTFSIFIISIAGAESVIGLSILVAFYRSPIKPNYSKLKSNKPGRFSSISNLRFYSSWSNMAKHVRDLQNILQKSRIIKIWGKTLNKITPNNICRSITIHGLIFLNYLNSKNFMRSCAAAHSHGGFVRIKISLLDSK